MTTVNQDQSGKMLIVFLRDNDKVGVCFDAKEFEIDTDGKFAHAVRVTKMELGKFLALPKLFENLNDALVAVGLPTITEDSTKPMIVSNSLSLPTILVDSPKPLIVSYAGEAIFEFYQSHNNNPYPQKPTGNGYSLLACASHSRIATEVHETPQNAVSFCEYGLTDEKGENVLYVKDTIGGFHPNFFEPKFRKEKGNDYYKWVDDWAANFKPFGIFQNAQIDRCNNHFDAYNKYVIQGKYTFWYRNLSHVKQLVTAGFIRESNGTGDINEEVQEWGYLRKTIIIGQPADEFDTYKINTNNYT